MYTNLVVLIVNDARPLLLNSADAGATTMLLPAGAFGHVHDALTDMVGQVWLLATTARGVVPDVFMVFGLNPNFGSTPKASKLRVVV